jgi:hypothetical protein
MGVKMEEQTRDDDDLYYSKLIANMVLQGYAPEESVLLRTGFTQDELALFAKANGIQPLVLYHRKHPQIKMGFWRLAEFPVASQNSVNAFDVAWQKIGEFSDFNLFTSQQETDRFFMINFKDVSNAIAFSRSEAEYLSSALLQLLNTGR